MIELAALVVITNNTVRLCFYKSVYRHQFDTQPWRQDSQILVHAHVLYYTNTITHTHTHTRGDITSCVPDVRE